MKVMTKTVMVIQLVRHLKTWQQMVLTVTIPMRIFFLVLLKWLQTGVDNDCDGLIDETEQSLSYGDVVITEIYNNPKTIPDPDGEWFEIKIILPMPSL